MKLADWLLRNGVKRVEFARRVGLSPCAVTQIFSAEVSAGTRWRVGTYRTCFWRNRMSIRKRALTDTSSMRRCC